MRKSRGGLFCILEVRTAAAFARGVKWALPLARPIA
ncbi:hypothetical protein X762_20815 [Mesorhizobium sp. LSHC426A00]|nr:hypothetical protein X767_21475 [Mesorhizobium sp. LSJC264A00]ESX46648.1 hypothetical protein X762_20815 [Mesorhizobium sp. LSHC426A00]ESX54481.1 hypothetical protein X761_17430 [Mesorhizobium sp. LSHC424B00]ESX72348.1 hypothetical protein X758_13990 [Mesorhizobium sp. LSHC416B00]